MRKMLLSLLLVMLVTGLSTTTFAAGPSGTGKTMLELKDNDFVMPGDNVQVTDPDRMLPILEKVADQVPGFVITGFGSFVPGNGLLDTPSCNFNKCI